jgi:hypothetical protein
MNCRGIKVLAIQLVAVFCQSFVALAEEQRDLTVDLCGIVTKTNFVEYMKYLDSIGFSAIQDKLNSGGNPEKQGGLRDAAWLMWEKDIVFPANDENLADWSPPTNAVVDSLLLEVRASGVLRFDLLKNGNVVANGEVGVFKSCGEPMVAFMHQQAERFATTTMLIKFQVAKRLDVSYLGAETNMLYITERGSLEDSVTYKNITLKIRYKDDSLSKHRKVIAEALMTAGVVTKFKVSNAPVLLFADDNAANGREKKNQRANVSMKDARNNCGKVLCDDSK